ncbi:MAG: protocatechuate 3,4-dioxygenase beta subunit [Gammaproteobacteria bacterium]|jgi:protocatechuate 3,4-dioxygenase beta subunit
MQRRDILSLVGGAGALFAAGSQVAFAASAQAGTSQPHTLVLWRKGQVGRRLEVRGRVVDAARKPLQGAEVSVRHAGPDGDYTGGYEGVMRTNARGEYILRTALPGNYGRPGHIHVTASHPSAGHEFTEIVFRGDEMLDKEHQQFGIVLETVRLNGQEVLVGDFDIVLGTP